jgi:hypothetical protein
MKHHRQVSLHGLALLLALFWSGTIGGFALARDMSLGAVTLPPDDLIPTVAPSQAVITPIKTEIITLPLVEQNSGEGMMTPVMEIYILQDTPVPEELQSTPTPTPTPLPPQTGTANLPIVIGATLIFLVIILAWLLVGWRPKRPSDF